MKVTKTDIEGVVIVEPAVFGDHRGFFMESWSKQKFEVPDYSTILYRITTRLPL